MLVGTVSSPLEKDVVVGIRDCRDN